MRRERGVALIIALVVVALATMLATRIGAQAALDQRRSTTLVAHEQAFQVALGAEAWAMEILRADAEKSAARDSLDEVWATPLPPIPIEGGSVTGRLEDLQGRFNLNNLVTAEGQTNPVALAQFRRLLVALGLEPKWADLAADWIDADTLATGVDGAEDGVYTGQDPPYRAANRPVTSTSELLALPGFGRDRYRRLQPYVAALPVGSLLNVCTAPGVVIDSLAEGYERYAKNAKELIAAREKGCYPYRSDVQAELGSLVSSPAELSAIMAGVAEQTKWFRATTVVAIGTTEFTLYSLIERNPGGYSRTILRSFGTE